MPKCWRCGRAVRSKAAVPAWPAAARGGRGRGSPTLGYAVVRSSMQVIGVAGGSCCAPFTTVSWLTCAYLLRVPEEAGGSSHMASGSNYPFPGRAHPAALQEALLTYGRKAQALADVLKPWHHSSALR